MKNSLPSDISIVSSTCETTDWGNITLTTSQTLLDQIPVSSPVSLFTPYSFYNAQDDSVASYFEDGEYFAQPLNSNLTVFKSIEDNKIVGCRINNISNLINK